MAVSVDEKILGLALLAERQQKDMTDTLAVMGEAVNGFKRLSGEVSREVNESVGAEIRGMDVGRLISERTAQCYGEIEAEVAKIQKQASQINQEINEIRFDLAKSARNLRGWFGWIVGAGVALAVALPIGSSLLFSAQLERNLQATSAVYYQIEELKKSISDAKKKP